jgi:C-terminal processing protease CtpA/Prc
MGVDMRKQILTSLALLPLFFLPSQAEQNWSTEQPGAQSWIFSSDEGGKTSYLGVDIADVTTERLSALKLKEEKGVEVTMVDQDAPAGKAGIKEHDVILTMNGTPVESGAQLRRMIHEVPPGRVVTLGLSRDGSPLTVKVQLADKHQEYNTFLSPKASPNFNVQIPEIRIPDIELPSMNMVVVTQSARSGLMVENITPQLGEFFGVKDGNGVLVRAVDKGSRADKAGFRAGDVIIKVNDQAVHDTSDFTHAVKSRDSNSVSVGVVRDKKEQNLNLTLPEKKESSWWQEESFDEPLEKAESAYELSQLQYELAKIRPLASLAYDGVAENSRAALETLQKSACAGQKKVREQTEKQRQELRQEMRKDQQELKNRVDRLRQQIRRDWADL